MKNINKFLIIAMLCGSAQASFEMKARIGGGIIASTNAKKKKLLIEFDHQEVKKAVETKYAGSGKKIESILKDMGDKRVDPSVNAELKAVLDLIEPAKTLIANKNKLDLQLDNQQSFEKSYNKYIEKDEDKKFVLPVGCVEFDFGLNNHDSKIVHGMTIGLQHAIGVYLDYDVSSVNLYTREAYKIFPIIGRNLEVDFQNYTYDKILNVPFFKTKKLLETIDEVWNIKIKAGTQYYIGPFIGWKITNNMNISFMPALAIKHSSIQLKNGDEVTKLRGEVMFGIMPSLKFEYNFNNKLGVYVQAGYAYFFDSNKKDYKEHKDVVNMIMNMIDTQGPKTTFNVSAGLSYKII